MPTGFPLRRCKACQKPIAFRDELSRTGLCPDCGPLIQHEVLTQISEHRGPWFNYWRQRMAASVGAALLDDQVSGD